MRIMKLQIYRSEEYIVFFLNIKKNNYYVTFEKLNTLPECRLTNKR